MRQNTFFTTRGMFFVGFLVSPAVMAMDSVPPSARPSALLPQTILKIAAGKRTRKRCRHKHRGEAANAINKRCARDMPVLATDVLVVHVAASIHDDAHDDENLHFVSG